VDQGENRNRWIIGSTAVLIDSIEELKECVGSGFRGVQRVLEGVTVNTLIEEFVNWRCISRSVIAVERQRREGEVVGRRVERKKVRRKAVRRLRFVGFSRWRVDCSTDPNLV
jgi:hypothetical protein